MSASEVYFMLHFTFYGSILTFNLPYLSWSTFILVSYKSRTGLLFSISLLISHLFHLVPIILASLWHAIFFYVPVCVLKSVFFGFLQFEIYCSCYVNNHSSPAFPIWWSRIMFYLLDLKFLRFFYLILE